jgi:hypothetical protein
MTEAAFPMNQHIGSTKIVTAIEILYFNREKFLSLKRVENCTNSENSQRQDAISLTQKRTVEKSFVTVKKKKKKEERKQKPPPGYRRGGF